MSPNRIAGPAKSATRNRRGQIAIGTLIIFIAMLLVAAITAGVLLNVAGILESETERTGEETSTQLSERLDVVAVTGDNITENEAGSLEIQRVTVIVTTPSNADDVDLTALTAEWLGSDGAYFLVSENAGEPEDATFSTRVFSDPDNTFPLLTSGEDRYGLVFEPTEFASGGLSPGESVRLSLVTGSGSTKEIRLTVPPSLVGQDSVEL